MEKQDRIFVAGHRGLVGSAIVRRLKADGFTNLILRKRDELDLLDQRSVFAFFESQRIDHVFHAAGRVGGIHANASNQADFLYENLVIATNVIHAAHQFGVTKLLFLGSSCIYPKLAAQPIREDSLLTGSLEPTNEGYALAKIAGLKLCEKYSQQYGKQFISAMPTNLFGINDNFHPTESHVIPGMMRRFHVAKMGGEPQVVVWGSGTPRREFLFVDDLADALLLLMNKYAETTTINVGTGNDLTIAELAATMKAVVGFEGEIIFDRSQPDGTPRKVLDVSRLRAMGWTPKHDFTSALTATYAWALESGALTANSRHAT